jgi:hypothetical protein
VVLELEMGSFPLQDSRRETRIAEQRLVPGVVIRAGRVYGEPPPR